MKEKKAALLVVMALGFLAFMYGLGRGIAIDPRVDMHGRMVAYAIGMGGLTAAFASQCALASQRSQRGLFAFATTAAFGLFLFQLIKTL